MAPGGIEPPHADSKSAALSTELRGLGVRVDEVRRSLSAGRGEKVVDENPGHRVAGLRGRATDVRREDDVRKAEQRRRDRGLVHEHVEPRLDAAGDELAYECVLVDDLSPRGVDEAGAVAEKRQPAGVEQA